MINGIISWSLHNRLIVLAGALGFVLLGILSLRQLNLDAFPDTTPVQVQVNTFAAGLAPLEVERQITFPVEQSIGGLPGLQQVRSLSKFGLSQVVVTFDQSTDIYLARQVLTERLGTVQLPEGIERPSLGPVATGLGEVFHYTLQSNRQDPDELMELRTLQDWTFRPPLRTVPGTAEVNIWGGLQKQYQVRIDPGKLERSNVTYAQVEQAVKDNNLNVGGGAMPREGALLLVHGVGRTNTLEQIRAIVITSRDGVPVHVGDVADVRTAGAPRMGGVTADGKGEAVLGLGFLMMGENGHTVTTRLHDKFEETKKKLPPGVTAVAVYQRTELVDQVIDTVRGNLFEGGLLVIAVLFIFLGNLRAGLVVALAIPLSMLFAFCGMWRFGISGSLLSLGALDFGLVVDSSVVMVENVMRHLAHDGAEHRDRVDVVHDAAIEVRQPTMFGELIIMIVLGAEVQRPLATVVIGGVLSSTLLTLLVLPVLYVLFGPLLGGTAGTPPKAASVPYVGNHQTAPDLKPTEGRPWA